ncbi:hypothetical protein O3P69_019301 [Scylla paramamosain]|uniref:G-protein coupled receptors family 3 profile domain-containing protein n=1 Tax=Scylla paramamosain TaxID=85552 RepID=A0AAW0SVK7_SCYPA
MKEEGYHTYTWNNTAHTARVEEEILSVTYDDGRWSKPYFDCGGGNIWMMTFTVPFFGYSNGSYYFKGTSGIDIDLRRVDIDQCPLPPGSTALNIFANSDKCKKKTTKCVTIPGLGFRRGSYRCDCRVGFYFPDTSSPRKYFNGSVIEEEYEKKIMGEFSTYEEEGSFECLPCAEGCESCEDGSPCVVSLNWVMRAAILALSIIIILCLPIVVFFTWKFGNVKVVRAASPALLRIILLGAFFLYSTTLVLYPIPSMVTCSLRVWLREVGFSLSYGALMLKTWRISVIFRVKSAKAVKITDLDLMKRLGVIVGVFAVFLAIRTVVAPPQVIVSMTADDLKAFLCSTDWWDHVFTAMEILFLIWGIRLCIMVRKAPSEFNESKFISMAIYNEFILSLFLNVSMLFLKSPADPDLLFIIFFCHTQLTITLLIALIFGSKFLQRSHAPNHLHTASSDNVDMQVLPSAFLRPVRFYPQPPSPITRYPHTLPLPRQEEFRRVYLQLEALKDKYQRNGNRNMVLILTAMQQAANTSMAPGTPTPTPTPITAAVVAEKNGGSQREGQKEERRGSKKERRCSDGVVMRPHVNNILASVTDKIVCATFQEELRGAVEQEALSKPTGGPGGGVGGGRDACVLRRTKSRGAAADGRERRREDFFPSLEGVGGLEGSTGRSLPATPCSPLPPQQDCLSVTSRGDKAKKHAAGSDQSNTGGSSLTSRSDSTQSDHSGPCRTPLQLGYRNAEFLLRKSVSSELTERVCRSLEYLDEGGGSRGPGSTPLGTEEDPSLEDRSVRSAHSTPRRSQGRRFREVRDPERARAFILYSLSDRATLTDEVTV